MFAPSDSPPPLPPDDEMSSSSEAAINLPAVPPPMDDRLSLEATMAVAAALDPWTYLARLGVRARAPGDPFLADGDAVCGARQPVYLTQDDDEEFLHPAHPEFPCPAPECPATFTLLIDFESHYSTLHKHECSQCGRTLPSAHLLELHLAEMHDSFFAVMSKKSASYECFLQKCRDKFWSPEDRRAHCLRRHHFPEDFRFADICDIRETSPTAPRRKKSSVASAAPAVAARAKSSPAREQRAAAGKNGGESGIPSFAVGAKSPLKKRPIGGSRMDVDQPASLIPRPIFPSSPAKGSGNSKAANRAASPVKAASTASRAASLSPKLKPWHLRRRTQNGGGEGSSGSPASASSTTSSSASSPRKRANRGKVVRPHSVLISPSDADYDQIMVKSPGRASDAAAAAPQWPPAPRESTPPPPPRRRLSLAMITGGSSSNSSRAQTCDRDLGGGAPVATPASHCDMSNDPSFSSSAASKTDSVDLAAASLAQSNPVTPFRTPISLARMGERLSTSSSASSRSDRLSVPNLPSAFTPATLPTSSSPPRSLDAHHQEQVPSQHADSPARKSVGGSRIPVFKRSQSYKVPRQICFGSEATPAFQSDGRPFWHSRVAAEAEAGGDRDGAVEMMDFEDDLRHALPDL